MSTKIYTGFRMECSWQTAHETIMGFRKEVKELFHQEIYKEFAKNVAFFIDCKVLDLELIDGTEKKPFWFAQGMLHDQHEKEPAYFDLSLFPFRDEIYGITFTSRNNSDWENIWFSKDVVEEYRYWNNTDRPNGISQVKWDQRSKVWGQILDGFGSVPSMTGFTAQCLEKYPPLVKIGGLVHYIPDLKSRVHLASCEILCQEWKKENPDGNLFVFRDWLRDNKERLDQEIQRVTPLLTPDLTLEMINPF